MKMMAGALLARLLEQVAHPRRADADEHLDELGAGDREERHPGLAGHRLGEQRLAGAGRSDQQHALGHAPAEPAVLLRVLQELDDLPQLVLGLVDAGDVLEGDARVGLDVDLGLALADLHQPAAQAACLMRRPRKAQTPKKSRTGTTQDRMSRRSVLSIWPV